MAKTHDGKVIPKAMILRSVDGPDYELVLIVPAGLTHDEACKKAARIIGTIARKNPDDWNFADAEPLLEAEGFIVPETLDGPCWDSY